MSIIALALMGAAITVAPSGPYEPRQAVVKYSDLDLSTIDGRKALDQRLDRAMRLVCGTAQNEPLYMRVVVRTCVIRTAKFIAPQRQLAVEKYGAKLAIRN